MQKQEASSANSNHQCSCHKNQATLTTSGASRTDSNSQPLQFTSPSTQLPSPTSNGSSSNSPILPPQCYHRQALTSNIALLMFPNNTAARISAEIAKAWNNEPDHVKREYEILALRERQALELKTFPDYQYTKSTGSGAAAFNNATTGVASGADAGALSLALESLSMKDGNRSGG